MIDEKELDQTVEIMRLMLSEQLRKITGILWEVESDRSHWDVKFDCRWGLENFQIKSIDFGLEKFESHIKDGMKQIALRIAIAYWKYMLHIHDIEETKE